MIRYDENYDPRFDDPDYEVSDEIEGDEPEDDEDEFDDYDDDDEEDEEE